VASLFLPVPSHGCSPPLCFLPLHWSAPVGLCSFLLVLKPNSSHSRPWGHQAALCPLGFVCLQETLSGYFPELHREQAVLSSSAAPPSLGVMEPVLSRTSSASCYLNTYGQYPISNPCERWPLHPCATRAIRGPPPAPCLPGCTVCVSLF
jgi:hypothetical protein